MYGIAVTVFSSRLWTTLGMCCAISLGGCTRDGTSGNESSTLGNRDATSVSGLPNIVFVVYDNTRYDRYSINGNPRGTSPFFDRLAAEGIYLSNAIAPATWTFPSHASMFTGFPNHQLKVDNENANHLVIDSSVLTIAQLLADRGYLTVSFADHPYFGPVNASLTRGFHYFDILFNPLETPSLSFTNIPDGVLRDRRVTVPAPTAQEFIELRENFRTRLGDGRAEYRQPAPETEVFPPVGAYMETYLKRRYAHLKEVLTRRGDRPFFLFLNLHNGPLHLTTPTENVRWLTDYLERNRLGPVAPKSFNDLDGGFLKSDYIVAFCDATLEALYREFSQTPGMKNTVYVVASDHGQAHAEHGEEVFYKHAFAMPWEYMVRAPALIHFPESLRNHFPTGRVDRWVSLTDLFFTIAELGDAVATPYVNRVAARNGASLFARMREERFNDCVVAESYMITPYGQIRDLVPELATERHLRDDESIAGNVYALYRDRFKLIYGPQCEIIGRTEYLELILLFDLEDDPAELHNLACEKPQVLEQLMNCFREHRLAEDRVDFKTLPALKYDPKTAEALKTAGYTASEKSPPQ